MVSNFDFKLYSHCSYYAEKQVIPGLKQCKTRGLSRMHRAALVCTQCDCWCPREWYCRAEAWLLNAVKGHSFRECKIDCGSRCNMAARAGIEHARFSFDNGLGTIAPYGVGRLSSFIGERCMRRDSLNLVLDSCLGLSLNDLCQVILVNNVRSPKCVPFMYGGKHTQEVAEPTSWDRRDRKSVV